MGMYDTFLLRIPIQCTNCFTGAHREFQTKDLRCALDVYVEGKPTTMYKYRESTENEINNNILESYQTRGVEHTDILLDNGRGRFWFSYLIPDKTRIDFTLGDGEYKVYDYCRNCKTLFEVTMIVKNGIFVGVKNGSNST